MPSLDELKHYRLVQWAKSPHIHNELLCEDPEYTFEHIVEREYRYECSIMHCRSLWDLRMTPSGIFCANHYLPWLGTNSDGHMLPLSKCSVAGCNEPPITYLGLCRNHRIPALSDEVIAHLAYLLANFNKREQVYIDGDGCIVQPFAKNRTKSRSRLIDITPKEKKCLPSTS